MWTNSQASHPSDPVEFQAANLGDAGVPADRRHHAAIAVAKLAGRPSAREPQHVVGGVPAHLDRDRRQAGQRSPGWPREEREVADREDLRMAGHRQIGPRRGRGPPGRSGRRARARAARP